jgi:ribose transport system substrate-binding protein
MKQAHEPPRGPRLSRTMIKRIGACALMVSLMLLVAACGSSSSSSSTSEAEATTESTGSETGTASGKSVAVVVPTLEPGYYREMTCGAQAKGEELGISVADEVGPKEFQNVAEEATVTRTALETNPDGLIYTPADATAGAVPIQSAVNEGLPVANVDAQLADSSLYVSYVGSSQSEGGKAGGKMLAEQIGEEGEVIAVGILPSNPITKGRIGGFEEAMKEYPNIKVAAVKYPQPSATAIAAEATALLTAHPDVKGFYSSNELIASGIATALQGAQKAGQVKLITWDLEAAGIKLLQEGTATGSVAQQPHEIGELALEQLATSFEGGEPEKEIDVPFVTVTNQTIDTPAVKKLYYTNTCE